ncbi:hypothetical protein DFH07DRAFT_742226, partial [Mycena maculata]
MSAQFKDGSVDFHGAYPMAFDPLVSPRERVQMVTAEIREISHYRFTVRDHKKLKNGHHTRLWCSQDEARKKKFKSSDNPDIRNRDMVGMKRYRCGSFLSVRCQGGEEEDAAPTITVKLKHSGKHVSYLDISMPPAALAMIRDNVQWLTLVAMVNKVQAAFPVVTAAQIHRVWMEMSELFWHFDDDQLLLTTCTDNTNSKHLELYSIMAEHDGAGFPLLYLLLSTASSIDQDKHTKSLTAWAKCVRDKYGVDAKFAHVDKDMAEIKMLKNVWKAKISLCWWHLRHVVRTRLSSAKLATTPYDPGRAHIEFSFTNVAFVPRSQDDAGEYEGGVHDAVNPDVPPSQQPQRMTLPNVAPNSARATGPNSARATAPNSVQATATVASGAAAAMSAKASAPGNTGAVSGEEEVDEHTRRTFCPAVYREPILTMMEKHYCTHPLLPGHAHPSPEGIKRWAITQMYKFCVENDLREVWAYLWENWYRSSHWELWARSVYPEIPILKTTMILESHWRRIKQDFLHHFHMPCCDLLAWILIVKLAPTYYRKLEWLLTDTGRY